MKYPTLLKGQQFGRWTVLSLKKKFNTINNKYRIKCKCSCGTIKWVCPGNLKSGATRSCGCYKDEYLSAFFSTHGEAAHSRRTKTYRCWQSMLRRCLTPSATGYKNYGGRGIQVCKRWHNYVNFKKDMGECPEGCSLNRKNNNGNYTKVNCEWATKEKQNQNTRKVRLLTLKGHTLPITSWAKKLNISRTTLWRKHKNSQALTYLREKGYA